MKRLRELYYGWIIVAVMTVAGGATMAMAGFNFGLFIRPMQQDLGISRQTFGWAIAVRQVAGAFTGPQIGRIIDRHGARWLLILATLVSAGSMVGLAHVTRGWQLIALFIAMGLLGMVGPGALIMSTPIAKWFVTKRGRAMAIVAVGTPAGAVIFVPLTQLFIDRYGWQNAWYIMAAIACAIVLPLALLVRRQPEDMGLLPDGISAAERHAAPQHPAALEHSFTVREAVHHVTFWRMVVVFSLVMLGMSSVGLHRIPHFTDQGISPGLVSIATSMDAVAAALSTFGMGWLFQRWAPRYVGAGGFVVLAMAVFLTIQANSVVMMFVSMFLFGVGAGGMILLQNFLWADYFGRGNVGAIRGASMPMTMVFSAAGPPLAGYVQDATGSYNPVWWAGIALMLVGALVMWTTPPPRHRRASSEDLPSTAPAGSPA